ncbi:hypothetical protein [Mucilaginibacter flavidus]|uniref:hypothetical protein n=1 Tax=Mucilaginibacter flavidus TaxID=2949309 RepID=UPI002092B081|nr:hypothetical protein [Mucilaginibacter flavidus]MCO5948304.1 hypothetical protein [Mucilaginibacter flavidus]
MELKNEPKGYYGFKLGKKPTANEDWFTIEFVDSKGKSFSDDNNYLIGILKIKHSDTRPRRNIIS